MRPRILIIDDEADNLKALERLLRSEFETLTFESGEAALKWISKNKLSEIDGVLSDQRMPGMSGSELLEAIKNQDSQVTRLLITGFSDLEAVTEAINKGEIWRYIAKPWEPTELKLTLKQAAERTQTQRRLTRILNENARQIEELKAKDWSRHYLFKILLHEFRTAPQILEAAVEMNSDPSSKKFIQRAVERFASLERELQSYLDFEKEMSTQIKEKMSLPSALSALSFGIDAGLLKSTSEIPLEGLELRAHKDSFIQGLNFLHLLLVKNNAHVTPQTRTEIWGTREEPQLLIEFTLTAPDPLIPESMLHEKIEAAVAWRALLEPFVGIDSLLNHSQGFRLEAANWIRKLSAQGMRIHLETENDCRTLRFLCVFPLLKSWH